MKTRALAVDWNEAFTLRISWAALGTGYFIAYRLFFGCIDLLR